MEDQDIMTARQVAEFLHLHFFTVHKLARDGKIPSFKVGNDWRFRRSALMEWIEEKERYYRDRKKNAAEKKDDKK